MTETNYLDQLRILICRLRVHLWVKPLLMCLLSVAAVFLVKAADHFDFTQIAPKISQDTTETLLKILASSMLVEIPPNPVVL